MKRRRPPSIEPSGVICCMHGDPCRCGSDREDWVERVAERVGRHLVEDTSEHGFVAKIAKSIYASLKELFGSKRSSHRSVSSYFSGQNFEDQEVSRRSIPSAGQQEDHEVVLQPQRRSRSSSARRGDLEYEVEPPRRSRASLACQGDLEHEVEPPRRSSGKSKMPSAAPRFEQMQGRDDSGPGSSYARSLDRIPSPGHAEYESPVSDAPARGPQQPRFTTTGREIRPSAMLQSPYVMPETPNQMRGRDMYKIFRASGPDASVTAVTGGYYLSQSLFDEIEDVTVKFSAEMIDLYLMYWRSRLLHRLSLRLDVGYVSHVIPGTDFYKDLLRLLQAENPDDNSLGLNRKCKYTRWEVPDRILKSFDGSGSYAPWLQGEYFIMVCHVGSDHWITILIDVQKWVVEVYDSLYYKNEVAIGELRKIQLLPVTRLFPRILVATNYWEQHPHFEKRTDFLKEKFMPISSQFCQVDIDNCGAYACMYVDLILGSVEKPIPGGTLQQVQHYRRRLGRRIFRLSTRE